jgi:hypothetical protein
MGSLMHVSTLMQAGNGVKMSWVTLERITRQEAAKDDSLLRKLDADRRPLRPAAAGLTDHELLDKLRSMGCQLDRGAAGRDVFRDRRATARPTSCLTHG